MSPTETIDPADLTMDAVRGGALRGRPITVLGLARSGIALARFLSDQGAHVTVYDGRPAGDLADAIARLEGRQVTLALGPDVDPATAWADAALVTTSPAINPDYPTTEPRLRAALQALVAARVAGDPTAPALVSEPDLFLRLCVAPDHRRDRHERQDDDIGDGRHHPGRRPAPSVHPRREHRDAVDRAAARAHAGPPCRHRTVRTPAADPVARDVRRGLHECHLRPSRSPRIRRGLPPGQAPARRARGPGRCAGAGCGGPGGLRVCRARHRDAGHSTSASAPMAGGLGVVDGWIVAAGVHRLPVAGGGVAATGPGGRIMPVGELAIPGAHNISNALAAVAVGLLFGLAPDAIRRAAASFPGVEHRLESVALIDGVRFVNDSQGTQPDAVIAALRAFDTPLVLIAGGRDKGVDLSGLAAVVAQRAVAAVLIGESGPRSRGSVPRGRPGTDRTGRVARRRRGSRRRAGSRGAGRGRARRRSGDRASQPGCGQLRHVRGLRRPRPGLQVGRRHAGHPIHRGSPMNLSPPIPRIGRGAETGDRVETRPVAPSNRTPVRSRSGAVRRERHEADYVILVVVVALAALGILMVYSSSALKGYLSPDSDTFATVGPQIQWAVLGLVAMLVMMRVDYRYLRLASVPMYIASLVTLSLLFVPSLSIVVGGSARWLRLGPLPAVHPAEFAKLAIIVYLAHWFAKRGTRAGGLWSGTVPFLMIVAPIILLVFIEPDLGTTGVITLTAFTIWFVAGGNLMHLGVLLTAGVTGAAIFLAWLPDGSRARVAGSVVGSTRRRVPHRAGAPRARRGRSVRDRSRREPGVRPERLQRLHLRRDRPGVRVPRRGGRHRRSSSSWRTLGSGPPWRRRTRSAPCSRPGSPAGCAFRPSSTSGWS